MKRFTINPETIKNTVLRLKGWWPLFLFLVFLPGILPVAASGAKVEQEEALQTAMDFTARKTQTQPHGQASPIALEELEGIVLEQSPSLRLSALHLEQLRLNKTALIETRDALLRSLDSESREGEREGEMALEAPPEAAPDAPLDVQINRKYIGEIIEKFINPTLQGNQEAMRANREAMEEQRDNQVKSLNRNIEDMALAIQQAEMQQELTGKQLAYTAEGLYILINMLDAQAEEISQNLEFMQFQLNSLKVQEEVGLITKLELWPLENTISDLEKGQRELEQQKEKMKLELKQLLGYDFHERIAFGGVPLPDRYAFSRDYDEELEIAAAHNFALRSADLEIAAKSLSLYRAWLDYGSYSTEYEAARVGLEIEKEKAEETRRKIPYTHFALRLDAEQAAQNLEEQKAKLLDQQERLEIARTKLESGVISRDAYLKEQNDYLLQQTKIKVLEVDLLQQRHSYSWFLKGIDTGGM